MQWIFLRPARTLSDSGSCSILESMRSPGRRRKCLHCKEHFLPNPRAAERHRYCLKAACRKARKRAAQRAWLAKPENRNYFRDAKNAQRVRDWQKAHPGYWKNTARYRRRTLHYDNESRLDSSFWTRFLMGSGPARLPMKRFRARGTLSGFCCAFCSSSRTEAGSI